jgi:predicted nucleic acid binding AN1-type Zn finger protein
MELLDKGKHCHEAFCHQLDYLPMQCKACKHFYCSEHFKYESHSCTEAHKLNYTIPECELCKRTIEFKRGKDLDLCLAEHMVTCEMRQTTEQSLVGAGIGKSSSGGSKRCAFNDCKSKDLFRVACENCDRVFCKHHRIPESHECGKNKKLPASCSKQAQRTASGKGVRTGFFTVSSF